MISFVHAEQRLVEPLALAFHTSNFVRDVSLVSQMTVEFAKMRITLISVPRAANDAIVTGTSWHFNVKVHRDCVRMNASITRRVPIRIVLEKNPFERINVHTIATAVLPRRAFPTVPCGHTMKHIWNSLFDVGLRSSTGRNSRLRGRKRVVVWIASLVR